MLDMPFSRFRVTSANSHWTDKRVDRLRQLYAEGESYSTIADELGVTRNAVSGKVDRLGLPPRPDRRRRISQIGRSKPRKASFRVRALLVRANDPRDVAEAQPSSREFLGVSILNLTETSCHYAHGDGPFYFCAQPVQQGSAYCTGHHSICYDKPSTQRSQRGAQLRNMGREYKATLRDAPP